MKKSALTLLSLLFAFTTFSQIGFKKKKEDIEKFKDTRLVVVLTTDSSYNASIKHAVESYWTFSSGVEFIDDTAMKAYNKPEFSYLFFSKSKGSKIRAKVGSCEEDFNGLLITNGAKFKKKAALEDLVAGAYCSNAIDTFDWLPELTRAVQMLNHYLNQAIESPNDKGISKSAIAQAAPLDKNLLEKKIYVPIRGMKIKGKEGPEEIYGNEVEEMDIDEIYESIVTRKDNLVFFYSKDENGCNKIITSTTGELVYYSSAAIDDCQLSIKDLKELRTKKEKAAKE
ncbi:MAG: hypothetical protein H3C45_11915 [Bacteroidia bacterium]|nr:hypothetical protein [Bacteroidia bacterium]MCC7533531.1 hypothetical protein [Bacteroidia bacterium]MCZ2141212.1 hypothetical protein [Bacteroidia bacterium]